MTVHFYHPTAGKIRGRVRLSCYWPEEVAKVRELCTATARLNGEVGGAVYEVNALRRRNYRNGISVRAGHLGGQEYVLQVLRSRRGVRVYM